MSTLKSSSQTLESLRHSGASCWQGPHHGAKKSTTQISLEARCKTFFSKLAGVSCSTGGCNVSCRRNFLKNEQKQRHIHNAVMKHLDYKSLMFDLYWSIETNCI